MRVCLITPPSPFLTNGRAFMSLGILRVAAALEQAGHVVDHLDLSGIENYMDVAEAYLNQTEVRVYGITATTPQMPGAAELSLRIRRYKPEAKIILGGAHVTVIYAAKKRKGQVMAAFLRLFVLFDVLVAGDGERAVLVAIEDDSPHIVDADDPASPLFLTPREMSELSDPARHLVDVNSYNYEIDGERALSIVSQQGCPFGCSFCSGRISPCHRRVRARSIGSVTREILRLKDRYGVRGFMFYDDELNLNDARLKDLMGALWGHNLLLRGFVRADLFTDEQAETMYVAGFRWILCGFESGSPKMLRNMNKQATVEDNTRCIEIAHRHGLKVKASMSVGHPGESVYTLAQTKAWLLMVQPDALDVTIVTPYPGSPYHAQAVGGVYTVNDDNLYIQAIDYTKTSLHYKGNPGEDYYSAVWTDDLPPQAMVKARRFLAQSVRQELGIVFEEEARSIHAEGLTPLVFRTSKE